MNCEKFDELYWLQTYGETIAGGEEGLRRHLKECQRCRVRRVELDRMLVLLRLRAAEEPKPEALQASRLRLMAQIRSSHRPGWMADGWEWLRGLSLRWELGLAAATLIIGLIAGRMVTLKPRQAFWGANLTTAAQSAYPRQDQASLERLFVSQNVLKEGSKISDVRVRPATGPDSAIEVRFKAAKEYSIQGSPDDPAILELLGWAVKNADNSGVRLQSVAELARASDLSPKARQALAYALVNDKNAGVRLKALEALRRGTRDELTEQAILNALMKDANPAVRISAIDALSQTVPNQQTESLLQYAAEADSNEYVRMQARKAIRQTTGDYHMLDDGNISQGEVRPEDLIKGEGK